MPPLWKQPSDILGATRAAAVVKLHLCTCPRESSLEEKTAPRKENSNHGIYHSSLTRFGAGVGCAAGRISQSTEGTARWLRGIAALAEDLISVPSTWIGQLTTS